MEKQEAICLAIAKAIRERSKAGQLIQFEEIMAELNKQGLLKLEVADQRPHFEAILREAVEKNEDLKEGKDHGRKKLEGVRERRDLTS